MIRLGDDSKIYEKYLGDICIEPMIRKPNSTIRSAIEALKIFIPPRKKQFATEIIVENILLKVSDFS